MIGNGLLYAVLLAASVHSGLDVPDRWQGSLPNVVQLDPMDIKKFYYSGIDLPEEHWGNISAIYDPTFKAIFISDQFDPRDTMDISILVHEVVHWLQDIGGLEYDCLAQSEALAYDTQFAFLEATGDEDPKGTVGVNDLFLMFRTKCPQPGMY